MTISYPALNQELLQDPQTYGYAAWITAHEPENIAAALNKVRDGTDGEAAITVFRANINSQELLEAIDVRDFGSPGNLTAGWFESLTQYPAVRLLNTDGSQTRVYQNLSRFINNAQGSQTRLDALAQRRGSRAEQLFGADTVISITDVMTALQLP